MTERTLLEGGHTGVVAVPAEGNGDGRRRPYTAQGRS